LPAASRTKNGERDETTIRFEPAARRIRTFLSCAWPSVVPV
jgi:hypothetical protein